MGLRNFFQRAFSTAKKIGHKINHGFNVAKHHARPILHKIKEISGMVREGAHYFSDLPAVGAVASQIGAGAGIVHRGASMAEKGLNTVEQWQRASGWTTSNAPQPRMMSLYN